MFNLVRKPSFFAAGLLTLGLMSAASAQVQQQWLRTFNPPGVDSPRGVAVDAQGNVYVTGHFTGSSASGVDTDLFTIKYDAQGNMLWNKTYDFRFVSGNDTAAGLALDASGNVYVLARVFDSNSGTQYDSAVIKYNSAGVTQWVSSYDFSGYDENPQAIALDANGGVYVLTDSSGTGDPADNTFVIYKLDASNGFNEWTEFFDIFDAQDVVGEHGLAVLPGGNVYFTAHTEGINGDYDFATFKYDSDGNEAWNWLYGTGVGRNDTNTSLAVDPQGNAYVTGKSVDGSGISYLSLLKYNASGAFQWSRGFGALGNTAPIDIDIDGAGFVYVTGSGVNASTGTDTMTAKYSSSGALQWLRNYSGAGAGSDTPVGIDVTAGGDAFVLINSEGSTGNGTNRLDMVTIRYDTTGTQRGEARYDTPGYADTGKGIVADEKGNAYVIGEAGYTPTTNFNYVTIKYAFLPPLIPGDIDRNGCVDDIDLFALTQDFLSAPGSASGNPNTDIDRNGTVDDFDLFTLTQHFLEGC